jgi:nucleoside-diphosphate-sugar epimerase
VTRSLVTGGSGFLGTPTVAALRTGGLEVAVAGRGAEGPLAGDLLADGTPRRIAREARAELLVHLAWDVGNGYEQSSRNDRWTQASLELLSAFAAAGGRRAVLCGTCAEYDLAVAGAAPIGEDAPTRPASAYARAKDELRRQAAQVAGEAGVELAWARPFFLFGPGERPQRLVADVIQSVLAGAPAIVQAPALVRDYLAVGEAGSALAALARSDVTGPVNVASGAGVALGDLARSAAAAAGDVELVRQGDGAVDAPPEVVADVRRLREEVGFAADGDLDGALAEVVDWWRARL